ncbi:hypothetical protein CEXT_388161 [Caerostris extrusa]|uniref:Galectin n=1 Tax=Caerostris extrusa TaxID=172846 RepID=A0AAV4VKU3_CAEEX|nr:hypothetical protein CEXT_388161 [Caerostris extrusa]
MRKYIMGYPDGKPNNNPQNIGKSTVTGNANGFKLEPSFKPVVRVTTSGHGEDFDRESRMDWQIALNGNFQFQFVNGIFITTCEHYIENTPLTCRLP